MSKMEAAYDLEQHRHKFAVWAAARAAQRGFTSVGKLRKALEGSGVREFLREDDLESVTAASFERHHLKWCRKIVSELRDLGVQADRVSFGRAAKLVAVYIKSMIVLGEKCGSSLASVAHPPIDSILLRNASRCSSIHSSFKSSWAKKRWTKLKEDEYYSLIKELREAMKPESRFWMLERYWKPADRVDV